jgi:hypothetical protein
MATKRMKKARFAVGDAEADIYLFKGWSDIMERRMFSP